MGWKDAPVIKEPSWKSAPVVEDATVEEVVVEGRRKPKWSELPGNIPKSAAQFGRNLIEPFLHPIQTARGIGELASGTLQNVREMSPREFQGSAPKIDTRTADAAKQALIERYGSPSALKTTMIEDPVGFASDVSLVLGGTGSALARVGGTAGKVGRVAETAAKVIDPIAATGRVVKAVPNLAGKVVAPVTGFTSITSPEIVRKAYEAGVKGGTAEQAFKGQMRGTAPIENMIHEVRGAVNNIRDARQTQYLRDMEAAKAQGAAAPPIDFAPIEEAVTTVRDRGKFKDKRINANASKAWDQIDTIVNDWSTSNPAEYHTIEGLDAMKRAIGDVREGLEIGSPARSAANEVYSTVRSAIAQQAPDYAKAMEGYENASALLEDLDKSLATNNKSGINTTLRRLMTILKEDSSSGFGRNAKLGQVLEDSGADNLSYMLAGRSLKPVLPQGLRGGMSATAAAYYGASGSPWVGVPALLASSPRLVGETANALGVASRPVKAASGAIESAYNATRPGPLALAQSQNYLPEPTQSDDLSALLSKYLGQPPKKEATEEPAAEEPAAEDAQASTTDAYDIPYMAQIIAGHEGTGDNPESSALGRFQFLKGTLMGMYNREHPDAPITEDEAEAMRADGRISTDDLNRYGIQFTADNVKRVLDAGAPVTVGNVYVMHFAGEGDGPKVLKALEQDPSTPITSVLGTEAIARNAGIKFNGKYLKDFTVQDFSDWAEDSMGKSYEELKKDGLIE